MHPYEKHAEKFYVGDLEFSHQVDIGLALGRLDDCVDWCKENLKYEWRMSMTSFALRDDCQYHFWFEDAQDAVAFSLKWVHNN